MKLLKTKSELRAERDFKKYFKPKISKANKLNKAKNRQADRLKGKSYSDFLNSSYWKAVRELVLKRDGYKCVICGSLDKLHIHHNSYSKHFREHKNLDDLMTLCESCHKEHHMAQD